MLKKTIAVTAMTAALVGGVLVTPGLAAGKGGGKGNTTTATTASISINQADPRLGDPVTFSIVVPGEDLIPTGRGELLPRQCPRVRRGRLPLNRRWCWAATTLRGSAREAERCRGYLVEWTNIKTAHMTRTEYATTVFAAGNRVN